MKSEVSSSYMLFKQNAVGYISQTSVLTNQKYTNDKNLKNLEANINLS